MGKPDGFLLYNRELPSTRDPKERLKDSKEVYNPFPDEKVQTQASRCMDCGVPFCHNGCPLGNQIPDFNDAVYAGEWEKAIKILSLTNNFPEFTGRICPAPCEASCVLSINKPAVTIELIEKTIVEKAFELDLIKPQPPKKRTGKRVAVIGSGPAGLAGAAQLNQAGHLVDVYEKHDKAGGLLRYGIPDFKLEKWVVDRRVNLMEQEGIRFIYNQEIGKDINLKQLKSQYDAVLLAIGSTKPRNLNIPNHDLKGVHFAMEFLMQQNRRVAGETIPSDIEVHAKDKHVIVIGGGDTGADCVGTSNRHLAKSVTQLELRPMPSDSRAPENPWPEWPMTLRSSTSHEEGGKRAWSLLTKEFIDDGKGNVKGLRIVELEWKNATEFIEKPETERVLPCDLALLAIGYERPEHDLFDYDLELNKDGSIKVNEWQTSIDGVYSAGDAQRGQSLVVWAISDGREAAHSIDKYLMGESKLPSKSLSGFKLPV